MTSPSLIGASCGMYSTRTLDKIAARDAPVASATRDRGNTAGVIGDQHDVAGERADGLDASDDAAGAITPSSL